MTRSMPSSAVVKTDDEIRKEMDADYKTTEEIDIVIDERTRLVDETQEKYDKRTSAPFEAALNRK